MDEIDVNEKTTRKISWHDGKFWKREPSAETDDLIRFPKRTYHIKKERERERETKAL